jgi:tellurite resistance protein
MSLSAQDALVYLMVVAASADDEMSPDELARIDWLVRHLPVFEGYDFTGLGKVANDCIDLINGSEGLDGVLDLAIGVLPKRLQDTAYALAVDVTALDLKLEQEELRLLEMIRDRLDLARLTTAAIEAGTRARLRQA